MKIIKQLPLAFYILFCYLFLSCYFAFERILNTDNSYYLFNILNTQNFWFAENRVGVIPSQIPLLLFSNLGASLNTLIYVYSVSFPLEYIALAIICEYYLKVKEAALTIALMLITGVAYSFFHPVTETYPALAFAILVYAILVCDWLQQKKYLYYLFILVGSFLSIISHPIGVFAIGFVALFSFAAKKITIHPFLFVVFLAGLSIVLRLVFVSDDSYDVQQYDALFANFSANADWSTLYPVLYFIARIDNVYLPTCILLITLIIIALYTKNTPILLLSIVCATGFAIMGILTFAKGDADMMMEKTFMPAIFMLLLPFCYVFTTLTKTPQKLVVAIILIMATLSFRQIVRASEIATERLAVLELIAKRSLYPKLIAEINDFNEPSLYFNYWNTVVDSYVIATCRANKEFTLFVTPDKYTFKFDSTNVDQFLGPPWYPYWNKRFTNNPYFKLPKTGYRLYENNEKK
jgi:hypothetical protein